MAILHYNKTTKPTSSLHLSTPLKKCQFPFYKHNVVRNLTGLHLRPMEIEQMSWFGLPGIWFGLKTHSFAVKVTKDNDIPFTRDGFFKVCVQNYVTRYIWCPLWSIRVGFFGSFQQAYELSNGFSVSSVSALSSVRLILMGIAEDLDQTKRSCPWNTVADVQIVWPRLCSSNPLSSQSSSLSRSSSPIFHTESWCWQHLGCHHLLKCKNILPSTNLADIKFVAAFENVCTHPGNQHQSIQVIRIFITRNLLLFFTFFRHRPRPSRMPGNPEKSCPAYRSLQVFSQVIHTPRQRERHRQDPIPRLV